MNSQIKNIRLLTITVLGIVGLLALFAFAGRASAPTNPFADYIQLSSREWIAPSPTYPIQFIRLPVIVDYTSIGGDPNNRLGDTLVVAGTQQGILIETEASLRHLLPGAPPTTEVVRIGPNGQPQ